MSQFLDELGIEGYPEVGGFCRDEAKVFCRFFKRFVIGFLQVFYPRSLNSASPKMGNNRASGAGREGSFRVFFYS